MVSTTQIRRYAWVVEILLQRKELTIREFNEELSRSSLVEFEDEIPDRKTWYKCFEDIGMIYGILIEHTSKADGSKWYILNPEALRGRDVLKWMLGAIAHRNLLEDCLGLYNHIDIEGFPSENGMLHPIIEGLKRKKKLEILYRRYDSPRPKKHIVEPHFIKTYNHRFYVLCKIEKGYFITLSFDRMEQVTVLEQGFNFPDDLFAQQLFEDAFGVMIPQGDMQPKDIIIRAKGDARFYLMDVPLHKSQQLVQSGTDFADFRIHIRPTEDFFGAVMQQGARLEIIGPVDVRKHMAECLEKALEQYHAA